MSLSTLKWAAIICFFAAMAVLLGGGVAMKKDLPPYPGKVIDSQGNVLFEKSDIFAGQNGTQAPFASSYGGVLFTGSLTEMQTRVSDDNIVDFSIDANDTFGSVSSQVIGIVDLNPDITVDTLISDLNGNLNEGIRLGSIIISDGTDTSTVDLSNCITVNDIIDKIFEPFYSTKKEIKGVGLGLSSSYTIINGCGGKLSVESEEGNGATFIIDLPVKL